MDTKRVKPSELNSATIELIEEFNLEIVARQREVANEIARETVERLKKAGSFGGKKYRKGWTYQPKTVGSHLVSFVVHNKRHYRLTHLLEKGHDVKNRYGTPKKPGAKKTVQAFIHIEPIEKQMITEYIRRMERAIEE